jgi:uncharacterized protein (UPF0303 family)
METLELEAEAAELVFDRFDEAMAWRLGSELQQMAAEAALPVVIDIRSADRTYFHAALPGSAPLNDLWARRKSNVALVFRMASLLVGNRFRDKGDTLAKHGLDAANHAESGGAVPVVVRGVGMVAVATVSGLPQVEDHKLVVQAMRAVLAGG